MNTLIYGADGKLCTEIDIHLEGAIVEATLRSGGKEQQAERFAANAEVNPLGDHVVVSVPNYMDSEVEKVHEIGKLPGAAEVTVVRGEKKLEEALGTIEEKNFLRAAQYAGFLARSSFHRC